MNTYKLFTGKNTIFYIGKTERDINTRFGEHVSTAKAGEDTTPKYVKMRQLLKAGTEIKIAKLPTDNEDFEIIKALRACHSLTNVRKGDQAPHILRLLEQVSDQTIVSLQDFENDCLVRDGQAKQLTANEQLIKAELRLIKVTAEANKLQQKHKQTEIYVNTHTNIEIAINDRSKVLKKLNQDYFKLTAEIKEKQKLTKSLKVVSMEKEVKTLNKDIGERRKYIDAMDTEIKSKLIELNSLIEDFDAIQKVVNETNQG